MFSNANNSVLYSVLPTLLKDPSPKHKRFSKSAMAEKIRIEKDVLERNLEIILNEKHNTNSSNTDTTTKIPSPRRESDPTSECLVSLDDTAENRREFDPAPESVTSVNAKTRIKKIFKGIWGYKPPIEAEKDTKYTILIDTNNFLYKASHASTYNTTTSLSTPSAATETPTNEIMSISPSFQSWKPLNSLKSPLVSPSPVFITILFRMLDTTLRDNIRSLPKTIGQIDRTTLLYSHHMAPHFDKYV
jgi:hypothetical protein